METIKKKRGFTRVIAMLLAALMVFSLFPLSALAAPEDSEQTSIPTIVLDENGNLATGRRKAPAKAPGYGGGDTLSPGKLGTGTPSSGGWGRHWPFVRYTLVRIDATDLIDVDTPTAKAFRWQELMSAAMDTDWFISVNAGFDQYPDSLKFTSNTTMTNALRYEQIVRNNGGTVKDAKAALESYLNSGDETGGGIYTNARALNYWYGSNSGCMDMPDLTKTSGTSGMKSLFAKGVAPEEIDGVTVIQPGMKTKESGGDNLLEFFYLNAGTKQGQMRLDAYTNLTENQQMSSSEANAKLAACTPKEIASLAFTCTGQGFCYRVIAEPGWSCSPSYGQDVQYAFTFRDLMVMALVDEANGRTPGSSGCSALYSAIAYAGTMITPTGSELKMAHFETDQKIDEVYEGTDAESPFPSPVARDFKGSVTNGPVNGVSIYEEVRDSNSFKGYGVGLWAGFQQGGVPPVTTTVSVAKSVSSNIDGYKDEASFGMNISVSGFDGTPNSNRGTVYNEKNEAVSTKTGTLSGNTLSFANVTLKDGWVFKLDEDALEAQEESRLKITVTETGGTDSKWSSMFPACAVYMSTPQETKDCTNAKSGSVEFTAKNGCRVTMVNSLYGLVVEKEVADELLNADGELAMIDRDYEWPFYVYFNVSDEAYSGTAYCARIPAGSSALTDMKTSPISKDHGVELTLKHGEKMVIASPALARPVSEGKWIWYGIDEKNEPELVQAFENSGSTWVTGFFPSRDENNPYTENYVYTDASGNRTDAEEMPEGGGYYRHRDLAMEVFEKSYIDIANANDMPPVPPDEPTVHMIVDYNINGQSASTATGSSSNVSIKGGSNPVDCGTLTVGQTVTIKLGDGTTPLAKEKYLYPESGSGPDADGNYVKMIYDGVWTEATGGSQIANANTTEFQWTVPSTYNGVAVEQDQMITLYVHWKVDAFIKPQDNPIPPDPVPYENYKIFPVFFNYNYTGGGSMAIECGKFEIWHRLDRCTLIYGPEGIEGHTYPNDQDFTKVQVVFGFADPHAAISGEDYPSTLDRGSLRVGWTFMGWTTDPDKWNGAAGSGGFNDYENCVIPSINAVRYYSDEVKNPPTETTTYYALWLPSPIYWYANSGWYTQKSGNDYFVMLDGNKPKSMIKQTSGVRSGGQYYVDLMGAEKNVPKREGYQFNGWFYDPDCSATCSPTSL